MSLHINKFIDKIKATESRGQRDFIMTINEAKDLHNDITKLLLNLQYLLDERQNSPPVQVVDVQVNGGAF
jgi:hypothetical protein